MPLSRDDLSKIIVIVRRLSKLLDAAAPDENAIVLEGSRFWKSFLCLPDNSIWNGDWSAIPGSSGVHRYEENPLEWNDPDLAALIRRILELILFDPTVYLRGRASFAEGVAFVALLKKFIVAAEGGKDGPQKDGASFRFDGFTVRDLTTLEITILEYLWDDGHCPGRPIPQAKTKLDWHVSHGNVTRRVKAINAKVKRDTAGTWEVRAPKGVMELRRMKSEKGKAVAPKSPPDT